MAVFADLVGPINVAHSLPVTLCYAAIYTHEYNDDRSSCDLRCPERHVNWLPEEIPHSVSR